MKIPGTWLLAIPLIACLASCAGDNAPATPAAKPLDESPAGTGATSPAGIAWFPGTVDEAFAAAREQDKPIFLYFGAEWCPYCKELQATVFRRDRFIELSRQFVAINLGVDNTDSISDGDRFNVYGLPTVIVFNAAGEELTRIAGGIDSEQYAGVLELSLNAIRPVSELVHTVQAGGQLDSDDWQLLATYSWSQDRGQAVQEQDTQAVLQELLDQCPIEMKRTCSRLLVAAVAQWAWNEERDTSPPPHYLTRVEAIVADPVLSGDNLVVLAGISGELVAELAAGDAHTALQKQLQQQFETALADRKLDPLVRAYALAGWVSAAGATLDEEESLPARDVAWIKEQADRLLAELGPYQQHAGINTLWHVYYDAGLTEDARAALLRGVEVSRTPYYFMSGLGRLERDQGNNSAALDWYRRARDAATGPTSRVRWSSGYLMRMIQLAPEDTDGIGAAAGDLIAEAASQDRWLENYERGFGRISEALLEWSASGNSAEAESRQAVISTLRAQMRAHCSPDALAGEPATTCTNFLAVTEAGQTPAA